MNTLFNAIPAVSLLLSDERGQYIPRDFVNEFDLSRFNGITADDIAILKDPKHEEYWRTWQEVKYNAWLVDNGSTLTLHECEGGLWLLCLDKLNDAEQIAFFGECDI